MKLFMLALMNAKICKECIHYIPYKQECKKFSKQNIITGDISYEDTYKVRYDTSKCSEEGIHFEKNNFRLITDTYHFLIQDLLTTTLIASSISTSILLILEKIR
jgi:hypothetical protein